MGGESCQHLRGLFNRLTPLTVAPGEGPTRKHAFADTSCLSPNMEVAPNEPGVGVGRGGSQCLNRRNPHPSPATSWTPARPIPKHKDAY